MKNNHRGKLFLAEDFEEVETRQEETFSSDINISNETRANLIKEKDQRFQKLTQQIIQQRGFDGESNHGLKKKSSIVQQLSQTLSQTNDLQSQNDIDLVLKAAPRMLGKSAKIVDGTELIKEIVKEKREIKEWPRSSAKKRSKSKSVLRGSKSRKRKNVPNSRMGLLNDLKRNSLAIKSSGLTFDEINQTFQKTNLEDIRSKNQKGRGKEPERSLEKVEEKRKLEQKVQRQELPKVVEESDQSVYVKIHASDPQKPLETQQKQSVITMGDSSCNEQLSASCSNNYSPINKLMKKNSVINKPSKGIIKRKKRNNHISKFIEVEAQDEDGDQQGSDSQDEESGAEELIDDDVEFNQQDEDIGYAKAKEKFQKEDQEIMQRMLRGEFKKKEVPKLIPVQKVKENRRKKGQEHLSQRVNQIIKIDAAGSSNNNYLPEAPKKDYLISITEEIYEEERKTFEMQEFLLEKITPIQSNSALPPPKILLRKERSKEEMVRKQNPEKRGSLIGKNVKVRRGEGSTALGNWVRQMKGFLNQDDSSQGANGDQM